MKEITKTRIKTVIWLLAFVAMTFVMFCKLYWPAIVPMFIAFNYYEKNADKLHELESEEHVEI